MSPYFETMPTVSLSSQICISSSARWGAFGVHLAARLGRPPRSRVVATNVVRVVFVLAKRSASALLAMLRARAALRLALRPGFVVCPLLVASAVQCRALLGLLVRLPAPPNVRLSFALPPNARPPSAPPPDVRLLPALPPGRRLSRARHPVIRRSTSLWLQRSFPNPLPFARVLMIHSDDLEAGVAISPSRRPMFGLLQQCEDWQHCLLMLKL